MIDVVPTRRPDVVLMDVRMPVLDAPADELVRAVRVVASGDSLPSPSITPRLVEEFARKPAPAVVPGMDELTQRETEVLRLVARGLSNAEIAAELVLEPSPIKSHVAGVLSKLDLRDRVQAVVVAYESGLVQRGEHERGGR